MRARLGPLALAAGAAAATLYPAWLTWREQGLVAPFRFFAADAFYFLAVADHSRGHPFYTFDGRFATNGFHPLWQYLLGALFARTGASQEAQLALSYGLSAALVALGTALLSAAVWRSVGSAGLALLAAVPGFYYALLPPIEPHYFATWSYVNGMESGLSILAFGGLVHLLVAAGEVPREAPVRVFTGLGLAGTAMTLARLDDVFVFAPLLLLAAATAPTRRAAWSRAAVLALPPLLGLGAYLAYNLAATGMLLPVSGMAKFDGLWAWARNGYALLTTLAPWVDLVGRGNAVWGPEAWRVLQMLVPAAAAALHLALRLRGERGAPPAARLRAAFCTPLALLCVYVLLKAAYNFCCVRLWHQGHWYYPVSILVFSWIVADAASGLLQGRPQRVRRVVGAAAALLVLVQANAFADQKRRGEAALASYDFWRRGREIDAALESRCPGCGIVELDDGILAYSLRRPVMSGLGLALDREGFAALRGGELLSLAHARGFSLLATLHYPMAPDAYRDREALRAALAGNVQLRGQRLDGLEFSLAYTDEASGVRFLAFAPRGEGR